MRDFTPVILISGQPMIGASPHLLTELFQVQAGIKMVHVPYQGRPQAVTDLLACSRPLVMTGLTGIGQGEGNRLCFRAAVLGQTITGVIDVTDDRIQTEVELTWLMGNLVKPAEALIRSTGELILEAP